MLRLRSFRHTNISWKKRNNHRDVIVFEDETYLSGDRLLRATEIMNKGICFHGGRCLFYVQLIQAALNSGV